MKTEDWVLVSFGVAAAFTGAALHLLSPEKATWFAVLTFLWPFELGIALAIWSNKRERARDVKQDELEARQAELEADRLLDSAWDELTERDDVRENQQVAIRVERLIRDARRKAPKLPRILIVDSLFLSLRGKGDEAEEKCLRVLKEDPDLPEAHAGMALALVAQERREEAHTHARRAFELDPSLKAPLPGRA